jgi:hypothetical protein
LKFEVRGLRLFTAENRGTEFTQSLCETSALFFLCGETQPDCT